MTIDEMIKDLLYFKETLGGGTKLTLISFKDINALTPSVIIRKNIKLGLGIDEKTNELNSICIGDNSVFNWLRESGKEDLQQ